jgi:uncharacterized membrane protein
MKKPITSKNKIQDKKSKKEPSIETQFSESNWVEKIQEIIHHETYMIGPIPPPEVLSVYLENCPDAYKLILNMTEQYHKNSLECDRQLVELESKRTLRGQLFAFGIAVLGIGGAVVCAFLGESVIGSALGSVTLINLVSSFIGQKRIKENPAKNDE